MSVVVIGRCDICGNNQAAIRHAIVAWVPPLHPTFEAVDRCEDVAACRARVAANGDEWPVNEKGRRRE